MSEIKSRPATDEYREGWDRIFGKKEQSAEPAEAIPAWCPVCSQPEDECQCSQR